MLILSHADQVPGGPVLPVITVTDQLQDEGHPHRLAHTGPPPVHSPPGDSLSHHLHHRQIPTGREGGGRDPKFQATGKGVVFCKVSQ